MRLLVDTNVFLDFLLKRDEQCKYAFYGVDKTKTRHI